MIRVIFSVFTAQFENEYSIIFAQFFLTIYFDCFFPSLISPAHFPTYPQLYVFFFLKNKKTSNKSKSPWTHKNKISKQLKDQWDKTKMMKQKEAESSQIHHWICVVLAFWAWDLSWRCGWYTQWDSIKENGFALASGYQLQVASWLGVGHSVHVTLLVLQLVYAATVWVHRCINPVVFRRHSFLDAIHPPGS